MDVKTWLSIEQLFNDTQALPQDQRANFLKEQCIGKPSLFKAVDSLLQHSDQTIDINHIIEDAAFELLAENLDLTGKMIGHYQISATLGHGGMGSVYLAQRADQQYDKQVAIKLLRTVIANKSAINDFKTERQLLAKIEHPYIARLLDGGTTDDGLPYLVMEYIEGQPIDVYCQDNNLSTNNRLILMQKVCRAVQYAHQKLIIHCDLKPANILIDSEGNPKLIDFGISRLAKSTEQPLNIADKNLPQQKLTLQYSSPEQITQKTISVMSDIYSLGVVLYKMLTGNMPFNAANDDLVTVKKNILSGQFVSTHIVINKDINAIVLKTLKNNPYQRYHSAAQFADDISHYFHHQVLFARTNTWQYRSYKYMVRNKLTLAFSTTIFVAILGFSLSLWQQTIKVTNERDRAEATLAFITTMFAELDPSSAKGKEILVKDVLNKASKDLIRNTSAEKKLKPLTEATIQQVLGSIYVSLGELPLAEQHLLQAKELYAQQNVNQSKEYLNLLFDLYNLYALKHKYKESLPLTLKAITLSKKLNGENHPDTLGAISNLASYYNMTGDYQRALTTQQALLVLQQDTLGEHHKNSIQSKLNIATTHYWMGQYNLAKKGYEYCVQHLTQLLGSRHPETLHAMSVLGSVLETMGEYTLAEPIIRKHIKESTIVFGHTHPNVLRSMHNLADTYRGLGKYQQSETLFRKTLALRQTHLGTDHIETLQSQMKLARLLGIIKKYDEALIFVKDTVEKQKIILGFEHPTTLIAAHELAELYRKNNQLDEALPLYQKTLRAREKILKENHPDIAKTLIGITKINLLQDEIEDAEQNFNRANNIMTKNTIVKDFESELLLTLFIQYFEQKGLTEKAAHYHKLLVGNTLLPRVLTKVAKIN
jgi:serine/threonine-protein kinase